MVYRARQESPSEVRHEYARRPLLIDLKEYAALLSLTPTQATRAWQARLIPPPVFVGKLLRWNVNEIERWCKDGCPQKQFVLREFRS